MTDHPPPPAEDAKFDEMQKRADARLLKQAADIADHYGQAYHRDGHELNDHLYNTAEAMEEDAGIIQAAAEILEEAKRTRPDGQWFKRTKNLADNMRSMAEVLTAELERGTTAGENPQ